VVARSSSTTYKQVTYAIGCTDRLYVTGSYLPSSNLQSVSWQFPDSINYMCGISEYSGLTEFGLADVDWQISGPNGSSSGSNTNANYGAILSGQTANSGTVHVTVTAHYQYQPLGV